jgi:hypothetical protein
MNTSEGGNLTDAGAGTFGGCNQTASAKFTVGEIGFGPSWSAEDSMAASIIRLECEKSELEAEVALLREEQRILRGTIEGLRDTLCSYKCADKASADGGWSNI